MNPDHERIIAKRIVLTGHPFKVHVKTATVRYMFFNRGQLSSSILKAAADISLRRHRVLCTNRAVHQVWQDRSYQGTAGNARLLQGAL